MAQCLGEDAALSEPRLMSQSGRLEDVGVARTSSSHSPILEVSLSSQFRGSQSWWVHRYWGVSPHSYG